MQESPPAPPNPSSGTLLHSLNQQHICNPPFFCIVSSSFTNFCIFYVWKTEQPFVFLMQEMIHKKHDSGPRWGWGEVTRYPLQHLINIHPSLRETEVDRDHFGFKQKEDLPETRYRWLTRPSICSKSKLSQLGVKYLTAAPNSMLGTEPRHHGRLAMLDWQCPAHSNRRRSWESLSLWSSDECGRCLGDSHATVQSLNKRVYLIQLSPQGRAKWASALCDRDNERTGWGNGGREERMEGAGRGWWWVVTGPWRGGPHSNPHTSNLSALQPGTLAWRCRPGSLASNRRIRHSVTAAQMDRLRGKTRRLGVTRSRLWCWTICCL